MRIAENRGSIVQEMLLPNHARLEDVTCLLGAAPQTCALSEACARYCVLPMPQWVWRAKIIDWNRHALHVSCSLHDQRSTVKMEGHARPSCTQQSFVGAAAHVTSSRRDSPLRDSCAPSSRGQPELSCASPASRLLSSDFARPSPGVFSLRRGIRRSELLCCDGAEAALKAVGAVWTAADSLGFGAFARRFCWPIALPGCRWPCTGWPSSCADCVHLPL
jgi:hypothetical protein